MNKLIILMFLVSCNTYRHIQVPKIEECRFLTNSIFCIDKRLNNERLDNLILSIEDHQGLSRIQKDDLINYFADNRVHILRTKEYEISFEYLVYFRGYFLTNPLDEEEIKNFTDERFKELDKFKAGLIK